MYQYCLNNYNKCPTWMQDVHRRQNWGQNSHLLKRFENCLKINENVNEHQGIGGKTTKNHVVTINLISLSDPLWCLITERSHWCDWGARIHILEADEWSRITIKVAGSVRFTAAFWVVKRQQLAACIWAAAQTPAEATRPCIPQPLKVCYNLSTFAIY